MSIPRVICRVGIALVLITLAGAVRVDAQEVRVSSTFDKRSVRVNEEINLKIQITGARGNIQAPRPPSFQAFDTFYTGRASKLTIVNGVSRSTIEFNYVLVPKVAGRYTLDPIAVVVGGQRFLTDPVDIEVLAVQGQLQRTPQRRPPPPIAGLAGTQSSRASGPGSNVQEPPVSFRPDDDNIFIHAWVDKTSVYPNEQILLTYSLYTRYDTRYEGFEEEPQISGFWIEDFPMEREISRETVRVNGKRYIKANIRKKALFPTAAAEYTINPGALRVSVRQDAQSSSIFDEFFNDSFFSGSGFFSRRENRIIKPPPIRVTVKPFPEQGKPASFNGAVGNFRMQANIDKTAVKQNEPVTMTLVIEGEGNIETLTKPDVELLDDFKVYESDTSSQLYKKGQVIGGRKTFEIVFIPLKAGEQVITPFEFSFFQPIPARYQVLKTPRFVIDVEESEQEYQLPRMLASQEIFKKDIEREGQDILYIWEDLSGSGEKSILAVVTKALLVTNAILTLLVLFGIWRQRREDIFSKNTGLKRRKLAKSSADSRIRELNKLKSQKGADNTHKYFEELEKTLTQYLSDKFNVSTLGVTRNELEKLLEESLGNEDPLYKNVLELYRICDESRFGMGEARSDLKTEALQVLRETITRLERVRK